jgi:hypothetical protein
MGVPAAGISLYEEVMITARSFQTLRHRRRVAEVYAKLIFSCSGAAKHSDFGRSGSSMRKDRQFG